MTLPLSKQSIFITGANGGICVETIKLLLKQNVKELHLACRSQSSAKNLEQKLLPFVGQTVMYYYSGFDMNDPESIKQAIENISITNKLTTVFIQAGGMVVSDEYQFVNYNNQSIEKSIYQNVVGGYLTMRLLKQHQLVVDHTRFVFMGGEGARGITGFMEKPVFNGVDDFISYVESGRGKYNQILGLGYSKFSSALLVQYLASKNDGHEYIWFSPGFTAGTQGLRDLSNPKRFIMGKIVFPVLTLIGKAQNPKQAALKNLQCLSGKIGKNGELIGAPEGKGVGQLVDQKPMNACLTNLQLREAFWEIIQKSTENYVA